MNSDAVLVIPRTCFSKLPRSGYFDFEGWPAKTEWLPRVKAESDERFLQLIPYVLLVNEQGQFWCYRRIGGEPRLRQQKSCGLGGHIEYCDAADSLAETVEQSIVRELHEELVNPNFQLVTRPIAWIYEECTPVGRVHIGLVYLAKWLSKGHPWPAERDKIRPLDFYDSVRIGHDGAFEMWSFLALSAWRSQGGPTPDEPD